MEFGHPALLARTASLSAVDAPTDGSTSRKAGMALVRHRGGDGRRSSSGHLRRRVFWPPSFSALKVGPSIPLPGSGVIVPIQAAGLLLTLKWIAGKRATGNLGLDMRAHSQTNRHRLATRRTGGCDDPRIRGARRAKAFSGSKATTHRQ